MVPAVAEARDDKRHSQRQEIRSERSEAQREVRRERRDGRRNVERERRDGRREVHRERRDDRREVERERASRERVRREADSSRERVRRQPDRSRERVRRDADRSRYADSYDRDRRVWVDGGAYDRNHRDRARADRRGRDRHRAHRERYSVRRYDPHDSYWRTDRHYRNGSRHRHYVPRYHRGAARVRPWRDCNLNNGYYIRYGTPFYSQRFRVPQRIVVDVAPQYDDYYYGAVFHADLGDWLDVYLFPVYHRDRVEYRPYLYCEGRYLGTGRFDHGGLLRVDIDIDLF